MIKRLMLIFMSFTLITCNGVIAEDARRETGKMAESAVVILDNEARVSVERRITTGTNYKLF